MRRWSLGKREKLVTATKELLPYLDIKLNIAEKFLKATSYFPLDRHVRRVNNGRSWTRHSCIEVAKIAYSLNPEKAQKFKVSLEDTMIMINKIYDEDELIYGVDTVLL